MGNFIGYTVGLECFVGDTGIKMVKVEYTGDGASITLQAVSGRNLESFGRNYRKTMSREAFGARPNDPYNQVREAVWALDAVGLVPAALDV